MKTLLPHKSTRVFPNYIHEESQKIDTPLDIADSIITFVGLVKP